jgi:hypothetical protein
VPAEVVSGGGINHACDHGRFEEYVLIKDNHAAYISWDEFERNIKAIANDATGMSSALTRGAATLMPAGSTMLSIRPIGSSPANWSAAGTRRCSLSRRSKERSRQ